jgi:hypothetical protein
MILINTEDDRLGKAVRVLEKIGQVAGDSLGPGPQRNKAFKVLRLVFLVGNFTPVPIQFPSRWTPANGIEIGDNAVNTVGREERAATKGLLDQIQKANDEANAQLFRLAMKMATGSGKTTVMAMLIAWQTVNAVRRDSKLFSRAFLIVAPGITIKDRLRVLMPSAPDNYYEDRELVPPEMVNEVKRAEIVITNYHAFQHRDTGPSGKVAKGLLQGNDPEPMRTTESDGEMLHRACRDLLNHKNVNVINDEAHHCYRHKTDGEGSVANIFHGQNRAIFNASFRVNA